MQIPVYEYDIQNHVQQEVEQIFNFKEQDCDFLNLFLIYSVYISDLNQIQMKDLIIFKIDVKHSKYFIVQMYL